MLLNTRSVFAVGTLVIVGYNTCGSGSGSGSGSGEGVMVNVAVAEPVTLPVLAETVIS